MGPLEMSIFFGSDVSRAHDVRRFVSKAGEVSHCPLVFMGPGAIWSGGLQSVRRSSEEL